MIEEGREGVSVALALRFRAVSTSTANGKTVSCRTVLGKPGAKGERLPPRGLTVGAPTLSHVRDPVPFGFRPARLGTSWIRGPDLNRHLYRSHADGNAHP